jgi:hypothetical protein
MERKEIDFFWLKLSIARGRGGGQLVLPRVEWLWQESSVTAVRYFRYYYNWYQLFIVTA